MVPGAMPKRTVVLGAGPGGLELASKLSESHDVEFGEPEHERVVLVDEGDVSLVGNRQGG
jgi:NADH dehydrogenase FAD-containing subunit